MVLFLFCRSCLLSQHHRYVLEEPADQSILGGSVPVISGRKTTAINCRPYRGYVPTSGDWRLSPFLPLTALAGSSQSCHVSQRGDDYGEQSYSYSTYSFSRHREDRDNGYDNGYSNGYDNGYGNDYGTGYGTNEAGLQLEQGKAPHFTCDFAQLPWMWRIGQCSRRFQDPRWLRIIGGLNCHSLLFIFIYQV